MKKTVVLLLALCIVCTIANLGDAQSKHSKEWDILGIRLGSPIDQAAASLKTDINNVKIEIQKGPVKRVNFSPRNDIIFGLKAYSGTQPSNSLDQIEISCDPTSEGNIMGISRYLRFNEGSKPSTDSTYKSIIDKYGKPAIELIEDRGLSHTITCYWFRNAAAKYTSKNQYPEVPVSSSSLVIRMLEADFGGYERQIDKDSGIFLSCCITKNASNTTIIDSVAFTLADNTTAYNSILSLNKSMKEAADAAASKQKEQGDNIKTKF